jgi:hypothetical protein
MNGSVGMSKMTALNATQKTGHGSLLRRGNHRRRAVGGNQGQRNQNNRRYQNRDRNGRGGKGSLRLSTETGFQT